MEAWKDIKGFENFYQISNTGKVRSKSTEKHYQGIERKQTLKTNGYKCVTLHIFGDVKTKYIHRMVAEAFLPNPNNLPCINHKDENRTNNNIDNLEWCDYHYNNTYGNHKLKARKANEWRNRKVVAISCEDSKITYYDSIGATKDDGFDVAAVWRCCNGKNKTHKNHKFTYYELFNNRADSPSS